MSDSTPVIVIVTAEWCSHCQDSKRGGANSDYAKVVRMAKRFGDVMIVNYPMDQTKKPDLSYIPYNFYRQIRGFPSIIVFKRSLWNELYKDLSAIGSPVRSGFSPEVLQTFLKNMGFPEITTGKIYSPDGSSGYTASNGTTEEQLVAAIQNPSPAMTPEKVAVAAIKNSDITHVVVNGQRVPIREYLIAKGAGGW